MIDRGTDMSTHQSRKFYMKHFTLLLLYSIFKSASTFFIETNVLSFGILSYLPSIYFIAQMKIGFQRWMVLTKVMIKLGFITDWCDLLMWPPWDWKCRKNILYWKAHVKTDFHYTWWLVVVPLQIDLFFSSMFNHKTI